MLSAAYRALRLPRKTLQREQGEAKSKVQGPGPAAYAIECPHAHCLISLRHAVNRLDGVDWRVDQVLSSDQMKVQTLAH